MKRIDKLTEEQIARFPEWVDKWIKIGLSIEPADFEMVTKAALKAYSLCNLKKPIVVLRMSSPYGATIGGPLAWKLLKDFSDKKMITAQVGDQVGDQVRDQVWDQVGAQVWDQVGDQVGASLWGQHDAGWLSWASYLDDVMGLTCLSRGLRQAGANAGWWWAYQGVAILTERPKRLVRDGQGRLHSGDSLALEYPDGWGIYAWHGVRVPERVIRGDYSAHDALRESNAEVRRAMIERMGAERFFGELKPTVVHSDQDGLGMNRRLLRIKVPGSRTGYLQSVEVTCPSTGRQYILGVPSDIQTCQAAVASTFGLKAEQWAPEVES